MAKPKGVSDAPAQDRVATRFTENLTFAMFIPHEAKTGDDDNQQPPLALVGHTRNISASGLALIIPSVSFGDRYLIANKRPFWIMLELPTQRVAMQVTSVRYERLEREEMNAGYLLAGQVDQSLKHGDKAGACLLGVKIKSMEEADRALYQQYLHTLQSESA